MPTGEHCQAPRVSCSFAQKLGTWHVSLVDARRLRTLWTRLQSFDTGFADYQTMTYLGSSLSLRYMPWLQPFAILVSWALPATNIGLPFPAGIEVNS